MILGFISLNSQHVEACAFAPWLEFRRPLMGETDSRFPLSYTPGGGLKRAPQGRRRTRGGRASRPRGQHATSPATVPRKRRRLRRAAVAGTAARGSRPLISRRRAARPSNDERAAAARPTRPGPRGHHATRRSLAGTAAQPARPLSFGEARPTWSMPRGHHATFPTTAPRKRQRMRRGIRRQNARAAGPLSIRDARPSRGERANEALVKRREAAPTRAH